MERYLLAGSTLFYLLAFAYSLLLLGAGRFRSGRLNLCLVATGFVLQTGFLYLRGQACGRCPINNTFEILIFLSWSIALAYLVVGADYRISLLGAFTAPLVFALQVTALLGPSPAPVSRAASPDGWLELHASTSLVAYGVLALACVAGVMYIVQERQLKMRIPGSLFHQLPPITTLSASMRRLLWLGVGLLSVGAVAGFHVGVRPTPYKSAASLLVWVAYSGILLLWSLRKLNARRAAQACVAAFALALITLPAMYALGHLAK